MYSIVTTAILHGINSYPVHVEADVSDGLPVFEMVGFLASEVKEARERVRTALRNHGYVLPAKRITVNLSPANIRKTGSGFDLPVAIALLAALDFIPKAKLEKLMVVGEIGLDGQIHPIEGILPIVAGAREQNCTACMLPKGNYEEARLIEDVCLLPVGELAEVIRYFREGRLPERNETKPRKASANSVEDSPDFSKLNGQSLIRRASEVAAAGMHNLLMLGPPGAGKTMAAKCIPTILPPMQEREKLELAKIYSVSGLLRKNELNMERRPFRSPHHTITPQGLVGGGSIPKPGEISLAHKGVLFLDELTEFSKPTLELLRQPMEEKQIQISRMNGMYSYPADFMLVAAMNPCPCGYFPDMNQCRCSQGEIRRYLNKISQPLLDRIDLCVEASRLTYGELVSEVKNESSQMIRDRVYAAWERQKKRFGQSGIFFNSQIPANELKSFCGLDPAQEDYLCGIYQTRDLTARSYHKLLRVARTIADLSGSEQIQMGHLAEAVCYRSLDKKYWERW